MKQTMLKIWHMCRNNRKFLVASLICSLIRSALGVTELFSLILALQAMTGQRTIRESCILIAVLLVVCVTGNYLVSYAEQISTAKAGFFMTADERVSAGNLLRKLPLGFFRKSSIGKTISTLTTTLSGVEYASAMVTVGIISGIFQSLVIFVFLLFYHVPIGLIAGCGAVCYLVLVNYEMAVSRRNAPKLQKAQSELSEECVTFIQGIKVIKSFGFEKGDRGIKEAIRQSCRENIALTRRSMPTQTLSGILIAVFESAMLVYTLVGAVSYSRFSLTETIVLILASFMVYASLNQAGSMLSMIGLLEEGIDEVSAIHENAPLPVSEPIETPDSNDIVFENVSFSYGEREVIRNVSFTIRENSFTSIIGPSGSGKTTLCRLIPRFYDVSKGRITLGHVDIRHINYETLMSRISMVFQNVYLFEDTVLNNIRFSKPDASLEEVRNAARLARCDDFIMALENGYDTVLTEGGNSLSGGEKQRISIARAILKDSPIIILDEATSALDGENEKDILMAIDELIQNKTVIMIAHRIKSLKNSDHIIAVRDGEIVEEGTHETLMQKDSLYKAFLLSREKASGWQIGN